MMTALDKYRNGLEVYSGMMMMNRQRDATTGHERAVVVHGTMAAHEHFGTLSVSMSRWDAALVLVPHETMRAERVITSRHGERGAFERQKTTGPCPECGHALLHHHAKSFFGPHHRCIELACQCTYVPGAMLVERFASVPREPGLYWIFADSTFVADPAAMFAHFLSLLPAPEAL